MIQIKQLPEIDIDGKLYRIEFENNGIEFEEVKKKSDKISDTLKEMRANNASIQDQLIFTKESVKEVVDLMLYPGAFDEMFKPYGKTVGTASYVALMADIFKETQSKYNEQFELIQKHFDKAAERKASKK